MKLLVWHWGRRGGGPLFALRLAAALREIPGQTVRLSLAGGAEILAGPDAASCSWREPTYNNALGYAVQRLTGALARGRVARRLAEDRPDFAICAMPALLDGRMTTALQMCIRDRLHEIRAAHKFIFSGPGVFAERVEMCIRDSSWVMHLFG